MNKSKTLLFLVIVCFVVIISGQNVQAQKIESDTTYKAIEVEEHSPHKATLYSALLPGLGQIYNKKYWKVPILYAGIGASVYAISWNTGQYNDYKNAYFDFTKYLEFKNQAEGDGIEEPTSKRFQKLSPDTDFSTTTSDYDDWFKTTFKNKKDSYRHDRDLSYIILFGVYVINIIDATVDAHLTNFNINDDLTMTIQPKMNYNPVSGNMLGLSCRLNF
ncbi:DUF5683 domain-containing protein [Ancylomarina sp. 16SWW S1-10-2]|uniref:DUF5683 domain-containing protein n=1 Tax=Ancylomarina sp. 16SWW S1-10-2 TaxID=2499681 RepID=UPI0012AE7D98|nr:DUF5683 domain-containing protein [Ancylomarina sp. 16SWW S1-10-2]MRT91527.1 hypothetical protein [Ancylomarina sp. 16SWW S1-10-2]